MRTTVLLQYLSAAVAILSAILWLNAARVATPRITLAVFRNGKVDRPPHEAAFAKQASRNAWAALSAAAAAILQAIATALAAN